MSKRRKIENLQRLNHFAAGIDIGSASHWVAVDQSLDDEPVRVFDAYTDGLEALADWLGSLGIETVAMESTGVYWIPLYELLQDRGLKPVLVDARATKQVAGRKTDFSDCQWTQQLHAYGLLKPAFVPDEFISVLRAYMRQRERWVADAARAVQHMQKAMELMNVKLTEVVSNITGQTGLAIIDSIIGGDRDPEVLSAHRHPNCKMSCEEIARALHGNWREVHLFALEQARQHFDYLSAQIHACDERIQKVLARTVSPPPPPPRPPSPTTQDSPPAKKRDQGSHPFSFDAHEYCLRLAGVDLTAIDGLAVHSVLTVLAEVGVDMSPWRSERAFGAWLGLAPNPRRSGRRVLRSYSQPNANRVATAFRLAARSLYRSKSALGAFYRRLRARIGAPKAITATAYKIARIFYRMMSTKSPYHDVGQEAYDQRFQARRLRSLKRSAKVLGYDLVPAQP